MKTYSSLIRVGNLVKYKNGPKQKAFLVINKQEGYIQIVPVDSSSINSESSRWTRADRLSVYA
jgi:hypothetical protein